MNSNRSYEQGDQSRAEQSNVGDRADLDNPHRYTPYSDVNVQSRLSDVRALILDLEFWGAANMIRANGADASRLRCHDIG